jgi:hypothetical protein
MCTPQHTRYAGESSNITIVYDGTHKTTSYIQQLQRAKFNKWIHNKDSNNNKRKEYPSTDKNTNGLRVLKITMASIPFLGQAGGINLANVVLHIPVEIGLTVAEREKSGKYVIVLARLKNRAKGCQYRERRVENPKRMVVLAAA